MSTLRLIFLLSAVACIVSGQQQGDLRFSGSFADGASGRLEVFINNQWGTICIDGFTKRSADTVCRQLGSFEALTYGEAERLGYGQGSGQIHITELDCSTNDIHILHCTIRDRQQCDHSSDVAVICSAITAFQFDGGIRLLDGPYRSQGILELYFFGQWGGVCGQSFDMVAADAACVALGYSRSRSFSFVSRFENMSRPVWVISSFINCASSATCFSNCYGDPTVINDLSAFCSNDYIYLNCEFFGVTNSRCLATPIDPNPNGGNFGTGGGVEDLEEEGADGTTIGIVLGVLFGVSFIMLTVIFCCICECCKKIKKCFKGCFESIHECLACCFGGCLGFLKLFDIRQYFGNEDNGNTPAQADTHTPNVEPRSNINQELEELELAAMNEASNPRRSSSSNSDSEHGNQKGSNEPPDYQHALKFRGNEKEDSAKPSLDNQPPPPSYDIVV